MGRLSYDAWGKRRQADGDDDPAGSITSQTTRGFTGHEQLDDVGLVHMNGRVYDPLLGRFGTPDPMTENPFSTQVAAAVFCGPFGLASVCVGLACDRPALAYPSAPKMTPASKPSAAALRYAASVSDVLYAINERGLRPTRSSTWPIARTNMGIE